MRQMCRFFLPLLFAALVTDLHAGLRLPALIGEHMVLQRDQANSIWGWAEPGAEVAVKIAGQSLKTQADEHGKWRVALQPMAVSNRPLRMQIWSRYESIVLSNILVGEVWVCSGQSNMQWSVAYSKDADLEVPAANYPQIRLMTVPNLGTQEKQEDFRARWEICTPESAAGFSAVGYFFGRQLHQTLDVPIGLIHNAWGGSAAEAWIPREAIDADRRLENVSLEWKNLEATYQHDQVVADWQKKASEAKTAGQPEPPKPENLLTGNQRPGNLWAGVLHPLLGYGIRGVIWYQGESNAGRAYQYDEVFSMMIHEWRKAWGIGDFPFYWVQLADFMEEKKQPSESGWAELREAQTKTLALANTAQAVIHDLGEGRDIHPRNKQEVAMRLARIALARDYGKTLEFQSPSYHAMAINHGKITLTFENSGKAGLYAFDQEEVSGFAVAGEDQIWHWARGHIIAANQVEVTCEAVPQPVAVRYAWADNPVANLYGGNGLPVVPFRTDDWPMVTQPQGAR